MGFPRQEYWSGLPFPSPEDLQPRNQTRVSCIAGGLLHCWQILYRLSYEGGDLPKMREASTQNLLWQTEPLTGGFGPCQALPPLLVFPLYPLQPHTLPSLLSGLHQVAV